MPQCIEDTTTASHRPAVIWLTTYLVLEAIGINAVLDKVGEETPSQATVRTAINLIAQVPFQLVGKPDVGPFFGEIHISWRAGGKQVVLMCFPDRTPLIHHFPAAANEDAIETASADALVHRLRWLRD